MFPRAGFLRVVYIFGRSQRHVKSRLGSGRRSLMRASSARFPPIDKREKIFLAGPRLRASHFRWPPTTLPKLEKLPNELPLSRSRTLRRGRNLRSAGFYGFNDRRCPLSLNTVSSPSPPCNFYIHRVIFPRRHLRFNSTPLNAAVLGFLAYAS